MGIVGAEEHALGADPLDQVTDVVVVEGRDRDVDKMSIDVLLMRGGS